MPRSLGTGLGLEGSMGSSPSILSDPAMEMPGQESLLEVDMLSQSVSEFEPATSTSSVLRRRGGGILSTDVALGRKDVLCMWDGSYSFSRRKKTVAGD